ncbi:hypothetical protein OTU49_017072 [Cherax quadricarinatus]|uniref:G-protein coupled receptors family 1 profile domain-containing protein n=1 Tax=Cherax quadricarinatus TaxID=27406 RepID=A0AAW0XQ90_CHEQU
MVSSSTSVPETMNLINLSLVAPKCKGDDDVYNSTDFTNTCEAGANCTTINPNPGATILSPILLSVTGVTGQVCALCYLYFSSSRRHNARTVFYVFLCTLIWTDFVGKMLTTPPAIISYAAGHFVGGKSMCNYHGFTMVLFSLLTHFTVSAMAVERLLGICHGYFYSRNVTPSRSRFLIVCIWVFCTVFSLLPLFNIGELFLQYPGTWCFANIHLCSATAPLRHRLYTTLLGVITITNLLLIVACNVIVVGSLLRMRVSRKLPSGLSQPHHTRNQSDHELQMVVVLVVITCVFVVSWAPLDIVIVSNQLWQHHQEAKDHMYELVAVRLASINQIVDPWMFRSRVWRCCRLALVGRRWSIMGRNRSISSFNFVSFLQGRRLSHTHSPTREQLPSLCKETSDRMEVATRPHTTKTTRVPSIQKSYYSDSGTGSYSGVEIPLIETPEGHFHTSEVPHGPKGTTLQHSLVKSLSVAIPIPLFTSEQYRVSECGREGPSCSQDAYNYHYSSLECPRGVLQALSRPVHRVASSPLAQDHLKSPFLTIQDGDMGGIVLRSNSWSCQGGEPSWPQYRTQSTQTLSLHHEPLSSPDGLRQPSVSGDVERSLLD